MTNIVQYIRISCHERNNSIYHSIWKNTETNEIIVVSNTVRVSFHHDTPPEALQEYICCRIRDLLPENTKIDILTQFGLKIENFDLNTPDHVDKFLLMLKVIRYASGIKHFDSEYQSARTY